MVGYDNPGFGEAPPRSLLSVGSEMRELRRARRMTLRELSEACGLSQSHLSTIERGLAQPSMDALAGIAAALAVAPDWFFAARPGAGPLERAHVVRAHNRRTLDALYGERELGYSEALISSSIGGAVYMGLTVYEPGSERPERPLPCQAGEEHGLVLEGELEMQIGDEVITLRSGDSYSFGARIPHRVRNPADRVCRLVWAASPVMIPLPERVRPAPRSEDGGDGEGP